MNKRGLSDIVTNVLIILLVLVAVSIIWMFLRPTIQSGSQQLDGADVILGMNLQIVGYSNNSDEVNLVVKRGAGSGELVGINVVLEDSQGNSVLYRHEEEVNELETAQITVSYAGVGFTGTLAKISVAPIVKTPSGAEKFGAIVDAREVGAGASQLPGAICGDGIVNGNEQCDGNSRSCTTSGGYSGTQMCNLNCNGFNPCESSQYCGDENVNGNEQCDDGNNVNGDGCSSTCQNEAGQQCVDGSDYNFCIYGISGLQGRNFSCSGGSSTCECFADINGDGTIDGSDGTAWSQLWATCDPRIDYDGSGSCDLADQTAFISAYGAGVCYPP